MGNTNIGNARDAQPDSEVSTPVGFEPTRAEPIGLASGPQSKNMRIRDQEQNTSIARTGQEHSKNNART